MKIPRLNSLFKVVIQDAVFSVKPLPYEKKLFMKQFTKIRAGHEIVDTDKVAHFLIKNSVVKVEGLIDLDDVVYELKFDEDGTLTEECTSEINNLLCSAQLQLACINISNGQFEKVLNPVDGSEIEGVKIEYGNKKKTEVKAENEVVPEAGN